MPSFTIFSTERRQIEKKATCLRDQLFGSIKFPILSQKKLENLFFESGFTPSLCSPPIKFDFASAGWELLQ